nr:hypothetical protein BaRGS_014687 [Batillaria attramentaria]
MSSKDEQKLVDWLVELLKRGFGGTREDLKDMAKKILDERGATTIFKKQQARKRLEVLQRNPYKNVNGVYAAIAAELRKRQTVPSRDGCIRTVAKVVEYVMDLPENQPILNQDENVIRIIMHFACDGAKITRRKDSVRGVCKLIAPVQNGRLQRKDSPEDEITLFLYMGENRDVTKVKKRQLRKTAAKYTIREDVLYHDGILVAKRSQVPEILQEFHDNYVSGGHLGMNKTYKKVLGRYFWHGMKQEVEDYCRTCCVWQKMNACRKKPAAPLHPIPVPKKKWSLVGMGIIGPLQVTDRGNQYIVALTDHFTKFPVAKAIPCKSSEEVARFMYETICIFGAFDSLITDQGREFINFVLDILTDRFNINHRISSAYHPQTNGQRERDNRTLKDTLAKLPFDVTGDANEQDLNEEIMDTMKGIHEEVKNKIGENISRAQKKQKEYYDSRRAYDHGQRGEAGGLFMQHDCFYNKSGASYTTQVLKRKMVDGIDTG